MYLLIVVRSIQSIIGVLIIAYTISGFLIIIVV